MNTAIKDNPARVGYPEQYDRIERRTPFEELSGAAQRRRVADLCRRDAGWMHEAICESILGPSLSAFLDAYEVNDYAELGKRVSAVMTSYCADECQRRMEQEL